MTKIIREWSEGSVSIAVEAGKDDMNREGIHVHVYKRGRRTGSRIPGKNRDLDNKDFDTAKDLCYRHISEIETLCDDVRDGKYDD